LELLARFKSWHARVEAGDVASRVLIAAGDLSRADGLLSALMAEGAVLGQVPASSLRLRMAQTRFWQARFEEAAVAIDADATDPESTFWRALTDWARGDGAAATLPGVLGPAVEHGVISERLACACEVECLLAAGRRADAIERLGPNRVSATGSRIETALLDWL